MCCTGMGPTEFWGEWTVLPDRLRIKGTKRPGRRWGTLGREVPVPTPLVRPQMTQDRFAKLLRRAGATPYQGRKSYSCWLEDADISLSRIQLLLGHGAKNVTLLYPKRQITAVLDEVREKMLSSSDRNRGDCISRRELHGPFSKRAPDVVGGSSFLPKRARLPR